MTVPFRPGGVDPGPDFLSTLSRAFMQTRNLVDQDVERQRAKQRFESETTREELRIRALEEELRLQGNADARAQRVSDIAETRDRSVLRRDEVPTTRPSAPFPEAQAPAGADISNQLADALGGVQERRTVGESSEILPEGIVPVRGQPGTYFDRDVEQRESERTRAQEAVFVSDQMEEIAADADRRGDREEGQRIRDAIPRAVLDVQQGRKPDTSALLLSRERIGQPTFAQQETAARHDEDVAREEKQQQEDTAIERALQESAQRQLKAMNDPAGQGAFVEGRDYEGQLENALEAQRRQETARTGVTARESTKPPLSLRDAIDLVKEDPSVWTPTTGLKIPLQQVMRKAEALVESATIRGSADFEEDVPGEPIEEIEIQVVSQQDYDDIVEEMGPEYAALHFQVGG